MLKIHVLVTFCSFESVQIVTKFNKCSNRYDDHFRIVWYINYFEFKKIQISYCRHNIFIVEEKFGEQNFRVLSEMRILGKIRVAILDFGRVCRFFTEIWREIEF